MAIEPHKARDIKRDYENKLSEINAAMTISPARQHEWAEIAERSVLLVHIQKQALEMVVKSEPLETVLDFLARSMEDLSLGRFLVAIHLMEPDGYHFGPVAAPSLPASYAQATLGMDARLELGCCSSTVMSQTPTVVRDLADDAARTRWPAFSADVVSLGLRGCFTTPIFAPDQSVVGTFAIYYREPGDRSADDQQLVDLVTRTVAIAIVRRQSEEAAARLAAIVTYSEDAIISKNLDGTITSWNKGAEHLFGYSAEEAIGNPVTMLMPEEYLNEEPRILERISRGEVIAHYETVRRRKNGTLLDISLTVSPLRDASGRIVGASKVARDITARNLDQEKLLRTERKAAEEYQALLQRIVPLGETLGTSRDLIKIYRALLEFVQNSMPCSAFLVSFFDAETQMRSAAYAWGSSGEVDINSLPPIKLTDDGGPNSQAVFGRKPAIADRYMEMMRDRPHVVLEDDGNDPNSSLAVPMIVNDRVIGTLEVQAYENGAFRNEHVIALDMVANLAAVAIENVRLILGEERARNEAETANRAKDEFLSVLSHELRTPLNAMLGWVRMLRSDMLDKENVARALEVIERNTRLQGSLIEDLLDVSRIISGKMRIESETIDLVSIVRTVSDAVRPLAAARKVDYVFDNEPENLFLNADPVRLQQVLSNLLQNAIKFTPAGGSVTVDIRRDAAHAVVSVSDTGAGIEPEFLPYIFDRFRQADASTKRHFAGLGLGLTIVKNIVKLHGGEIEVASEGRNRGSVFTVTLPLSEDFYDARTAAELPRLFVDGSGLAGVSILLVDDDAESIEPLRMFLERESARVESVSSAQAALRLLGETKFDLLISDIGMPDMDGLELIAKVRSIENGGPPLPAIALTAYASPEDRGDVLEAGFQTHVSKPVDFQELLDVIKGFV